MAERAKRARSGGDCGPPPFQHRLGYLLSRVGRLVDVDTDQVAATLSIKRRHLEVLGLIAQETLSQRELGARAGLDRTTMVAVIDDLERLDLAVRRRGDRDRRRFFVVLTEHGATMLESALSRLDVCEARLFGALRSAEQAEFERLLRKLLDGQ